MSQKTKSAPDQVDNAAGWRRLALQHEAFREGRAERAAMVRLGKMLRQMREGADITQEELARRTAMTQPAISRIEQGFSTHTPTIDTLLRYVHGCNRKLLIGAGAAHGAQPQDLAAYLELRTEL